ncbi:MAG: hypothetical protein M3410_14165 [Acidobacteriota bacterium]|nr:hypothetical protein [Acidobacteriota bacterium]
MTLYIGVDIHARQQTVSFLDTSDGTTGQVVLEHEGDDIKGFYGQFQGEVIIGIEGCGYTNWFEELMELLGHQLLVGDCGGDQKVGASAPEERSPRCGPVAGPAGT